MIREYSRNLMTCVTPATEVLIVAMLMMCKGLYLLSAKFKPLQSTDILVLGGN